MSSHSILAPSAAHRWLSCPASAKLEAQEPQSSSGFADEGSLAHAMCAERLKNYLGLPTDKEHREQKKFAQHASPEMADYADEYAAEVIRRHTEARHADPSAALLVEVRLDMRRYVPECYGTADAVIVTTESIEIIDFKYGKGVAVYATDNPQLKLYALGALDYFTDFDIKRVRLTVAQPRIDNYSEWDTTAAELEEWGEHEVRFKAAEAMTARDPRQAPGEWCRFCRVKGKCAAIAKMALGLNLQYSGTLDAATIGTEVLPRLAAVKQWVAAVEEEAMTRALQGETIPGYKLVRGRSVREITDPQEVAKALHNAFYAANEYMAAPKLKGLSELEKLVGKKKFAELCGKWLHKPEGKPTLVPESDKREAINTITEDFGDMIQQ